MEFKSNQNVITKEQISSLFRSFKDLAVSYNGKSELMADEEWLSKQYQAAFPNITDKEANELGKATIQGVSRFKSTFNEIKNAAATGKSKEQWFAEKIGNDLQGLDINKAGNAVQEFAQALVAGNQNMMDENVLSSENGELVISISEPQKENEVIHNEWNSFTMKDALLNIGQNAALVGLQSMAQANTYEFAQSALLEEEGSTSAIKEFVDTDNREQIKTLLTAAIKIGADSGNFPIIPKSTSVDTIANLASHGVEYYSALSDFAEGRITLMQAMDHVGLSGVSFIYNIFNKEGITELSRTLISQIPVVGPVLANIIAPVISTVVDKKLGEVIQKTMRQVENTVRTVVNSAWERIKNTGKKIKNKIKNFCSWLLA